MNRKRNLQQQMSDSWAKHKVLVQSQGHIKKKSGTSGDELSQYLANPLMPLEQREDMKHVFPLLYKQARIHFSIVATSVPCKRLLRPVPQFVRQEIVY